ncbi:bifunctional hydroxymethylpyrimidine kinase/phosphomethylpyrimidine kinase [Acetobacterium sp.]|jgi:hydroxymethylpyrimidine/phosphomethylpyrimidine kinase|uniref:bifunctional hydroxymethylpyrimidine kinase/phosphomethylpyrimidine kinase n=1 Tax=Acetobacterium sp. TaxID=1872094 RepID=UPI000CC78FDB|nr:bifunctional hydroxymethylpyrimidine kinase/phosphomethylpyrimidine kinase [Acetobacterium sp.]MDO9492367.1 bifunctional hydroxymethylpyrimidine kinase/phosphomethylpyrimidine kinase [Acetobacterium sp.]PKM74844.1 MAG: bifunctional hydroxymethylpyrimidine kinase/phosphomethylpyrimidine kinase [Firmicutes bacterium HGW-Firmicutes-17]
MKKVLSIAGSDSSGGAGIQADIKTIIAHGSYAMTVITVLTAQNTTGVYGIAEVAPEFVENQLDCVFTDIFPDAVKIGMVYNATIIGSITQKLKQYQARNIVLDPVMVATSGGRLLSDDSIESLKTELMPLADLITPNIPEAECLCGFGVHSRLDMVRAAKKIAETYAGSILIKGGHLFESADDFLLIQNQKGNEEVWFPGVKIDNPNTHGTGCTLSSAIACNLAAGDEMKVAVKKAKDYVSGALLSNLDLGHGSGPLDHGFQLTRG